MKLSQNNKLGITLLMTNAFIFIPCSFYTPFLSAYYTKAGLNAVQIGILLTIGPLVAIFIQPVWAILSDRSGRRIDVLSLLVFGSGIAMFSFYIGHSFLTFFIAAFLLAIFSTAIFPLSDAIILDTASKNQLDFSRIRMGGTIGFAIFVIFAGAIVKKNPELEFALGFAGYMILLFFVRRLPGNDIKSQNTQKPLVTEPIKNNRKGLLHIFESKQVYFMLIFAFINQAGLTFNGSFLGVYMTQLGYSEDIIGIMNCVAAISEIPVLFLINKLLRKVSPIKIIIVSSLLLGLRMFIVTGGSVGFFAFAQALNGLTYMTIYFCCAVFISKNVQQINLSKGQSILTIVQAGIGSIVGNIVGGYFADMFGLRIAYMYMAALVIITSATFVLLMIIYRKVTKVSS